jgi:SAM-dependent methyltransferase
VRFDSTGKVSLEHIYTQPDPRAYFSALRELDYHIPQLAKPYFTDLVAEYREARTVAVPQVLDVGSSYGINAALLRCGVSMSDLYDRYTGVDVDDLPRSVLLARDRELVARAQGVQVRFLGLDISHPALRYAKDAGFLDDVLLADLERYELTAHQRALLAGTDVVISTGCLGYVTGTTLAKVVAACERPPWMAHFVLRMFPFEPIADALAEYGYHTVRLDRVFRQRRFIAPDEQTQVLDTLAAVGVDPSGLETDGWFYAQLYVSRPRAYALRSPRPSHREGEK